MTFGGYDLEKYSQPSSNLSYHKAKNGTYYWSLTLQDMNLFDDKNSSVGKNFSEGKNASIIVDSGTSYILMPNSSLQNFKKLLEDEKGMSCDTDS